MKKALIFLFLFSSFVFYSQNGELSGKILYEADNTPNVQAVLLLLKDQTVKFSASTDIDGNYSIKNIPIGIYELKVTSFGIKEMVFANFEIKEGTKGLNLFYPEKCIESKKVCPKGHTDQLIPIVYGMPGKKLLLKSEKGKVKLGGCVVSNCDPQWYCKLHDLEF